MSRPSTWQTAGGFSTPEKTVPAPKGSGQLCGSETSRDGTDTLILAAQGVRSGEALRNKVLWRSPSPPCRQETGSGTQSVLDQRTHVEASTFKPSSGVPGE